MTPLSAVPLIRRAAPAQGGATVARLVAVWVWLLVGVSASYWGLQGWGSGATLKVPTSKALVADDDTQAVARALGAGPASVASGSERPVQASAQHALLGVVRHTQGQGVVLIATDGQPAKAYRVGMALPDGWVLAALTPREAVLRRAEGAQEVRLTLPPKP